MSVRGTNEIQTIEDCVRHFEIALIDLDHREEDYWDINAAKDVEMSEVGLGDTDQLDERSLGRSIQSLAISEQLQNCCRQILLTQADDTIVDDHEQREEDENDPDIVDIWNVKLHDNLSSV